MPWLGMDDPSTSAPVTLHGPLEDSWATHCTYTCMNAKLQALLYGDLVGWPVCYKMPTGLSFPMLLSLSFACVCVPAAFRGRGRSRAPSCPPSSPSHRACNVGSFGAVPLMNDLGPWWCVDGGVECWPCNRVAPKGCRPAGFATCLFFFFLPSIYICQMPWLYPNSPASFSKFFPFAKKSAWTTCNVFFAMP